MIGRVGHPINSLGAYAPEDIDSLLDATECFAQQFDLDRDLVLREIAITLRRRVEFDRLKKRFGISILER